MAISIITYMEVYQGTLRSPDRMRSQAALAAFLSGIPVVPLTTNSARRCAELRDELARQGKRVRSRALELIIAAIAIERAYTLVTRNRGDYEDIPGIRLYDW